MKLIPLKKLTWLLSTIITFLVDSFDIIDHLKSIISLTGGGAFFNLRYNRVDPLASFYKSILIPACNLKSQVCHYYSCLNDYTDSTQGIYESTNGGDLLIVIDTEASNSIIPKSTDFDK